MRISDWSSDVCSSDLHRHGGIGARQLGFRRRLAMGGVVHLVLDRLEELRARLRPRIIVHGSRVDIEHLLVEQFFRRADVADAGEQLLEIEIGEHTSELQSLMRISYAVFCLKKKTQKHV